MTERVPVTLNAPPFPCPVVLVTAAVEGKDSIVTLAWVGMLSSTPMSVGVGIRPSRFTYGLIVESGEFAVNVPGADLLAKVDACGTTSGRNVDKFVTQGLTRVKAQRISAPIIAECPVALECKLEQTLDLGSHTLFVGEVVAASADRSVLDEAGHLHLDALDPIAYIGGRYRSLGAVIGEYGKVVGRTEPR
jgi:flavin reductase (DIM6/NTAB) family NADH-FMN oxidoreductase RutF